jgi:hypothetical protein
VKGKDREAVRVSPLRNRERSSVGCSRRQRVGALTHERMIVHPSGDRRGRSLGEQRGVETAGWLFEAA